MDGHVTMTDKGYVQVYTGDGKGKTTAALGLALRAAGAEYRVFIGQFMKKGEYSEIKALERLSPHVTVTQYGRKGFISAPSEEDIRTAQHGFEEIGQVISSGEYRIVILDELLVAVDLGLVPAEDLLQLLSLRPPHVELVLTGRNAHPAIIDAADLVTEMREVKHYFHKGVGARRGIED